MPGFTYTQIAKMIDHSLLQQQLTDTELDQGCSLAREYDVASVCIKPYAVARARELLAGSTVAVGTTIGFPQGGHVTAIKGAEALQALKDGATELDMVVNIGKVLSKDWRYVTDDIRAVVEVAHAQKALVKVMQHATGEKTKMWGPSIIGFGSYHYKYDSGREGDSCLTGFSSRAGDIVLYLVAEFPGRDGLLAQLGKHKAKGGCLYVKRLGDVDQKVLAAIVVAAVAERKRNHA